MKTNNSFILQIFIVSILFILPQVRVQGQDIIVKKNGEEIKAKVTEILDADIKYRKYDNLEGPIYSLKKVDALIIIFENGKREVINPQNTPYKQNAPQPQNLNPAITRDRIVRAQAGSIINYSILIPLIGLGTGIIIGNEIDNQVTLVAIAGGLAGIAIPIASLISGNPMRKAGVRGSPACRVFGWITFGLSTVLTIGSISDYDKGAADAVAPLAIISTTLFGLDKSLKAVQARTFMRPITLQPTIGYIRNFDGKNYQTMGIRMNF